MRFGLIMDETDLEELIALVFTTGREVEESSKVSAQLDVVLLSSKGHSLKFVEFLPYLLTE